MIQTRKNYKKISEDYFIEDVNGFIIGFEWVDSNSILRRCLYISSIDDLINETTSAICRYEMFDPETNTWLLRKTEISLAKMDSYIYYNHPDKLTDTTKQDGALETSPYEDNLDLPIYDVDGITIIGYIKKLKDFLIPEFLFFYNIQLQIFNGVMQSIQVRKFGATGFN